MGKIHTGGWWDGTVAPVFCDCGSLVQVSPRLCSAVECKTAVVGTEAAMGLSLWSAAVGTTEKHWETWAGQINTSSGVAALPPASNPNGQTELWLDFDTTATLYYEKGIFHWIARAIPVGVNWLKSIFERSPSRWHILTHKGKSHHPLIRSSFIFSVL